MNWTPQPKLPEIDGVNLESPADIAKFLRTYNAWRRGFPQVICDEIEMPAPRDIGLVIDAAIGMLEKLDSPNAEPTTPSPAPTPTYSYCEDGEYFTGEFDSPEQAAIEVFSLDSSRESIEVGENVMYPITHYISGQSIVDDMKCAAEDVAGECAEHWLDVCTDEQLAQLEALVADWAEKIDPVTFFAITNVRTITRGELVERGLLQEDAA